MNTREKARGEIIEFIKSEGEKCTLLTGTFQNEKHPLVLRTINELLEGCSILFRANSMQNLGSFFNNHSTNFKTGVAYKLGKSRMYIDTINPMTWKKSPHNLDIAVVYPFDSVTKNNSKKRIMDDLFTYRDIQKIFLVSWTDTHDFSWAEEYIDRKIVFDAEEEDPEYHERMIDYLSKYK
ncbi:hypothetical protein [Bacillus kwashiorkori]|uniref:hypothetical protein n=1 Tax=Bacillus kwashiorkori TaxID=1522318 RepID=UPI000781AF05|nr:hypothetical protein [Bacillus kwashiorkori]